MRIYINPLPESYRKDTDTVVILVYLLCKMIYQGILVYFMCVYLQNQKEGKDRYNR